MSQTQQLSPTQREVLALVIGAVIDAVKAAGPTGAPGGVIYAAMSAQGATFNQYQSLMSGLVKAGRLRLDGDCYHLANMPAPKRGAF